MGNRRATAKRVFGEISQLPSRGFRARYTGPDGNRHSAPVTFVAKIDAEGWLVEQERPISRGDWRPPTAQRRDTPLLMGEYAPVVVARRRIRPARAALYAKLLRLTILPTWADRALDDNRRDRHLVRRDAEHPNPTSQRLRITQIHLQRSH